MNKDKQSSFSEKLTDILNQLCHGAYTGKYTDEQAHKAILDLVKSIVPDEKYVDEEPPYCAKYWNICRQEILDKLDSPKEL